MRPAIVLLGTLLVASCGTSGATDTGSPSLDTPPPTAAVETTTPATTVPIASVAVSPAVDEVLTNFGAEGIERLGGVACATEMATIFVAGREADQAADGGAEPSPAEVMQSLDAEPVLWRLDDNDLIRPTPGSGCVDVVAEGERDDQRRACQANLKTLETATEAYILILGVEPTSQQDLIDQDYVVDVAPDFEVTGSEVRPRAGSECEAMLEEVRERQAAEAAAGLDDPEACRIALRTLQTAVEAYFAQFETVPASQAALVTIGMLAAEYPDFALGPDGTVDVTSGSSCELD